MSIEIRGLETQATVAPIAFVTPKTPCEQAWADLYDGLPNERAEMVIAALGGWDACLPLMFRDFSGHFYDCEDGASCSTRLRNGGEK